MIETITEQHPNHLIVIGGDINSELKGQSPFDTYWSDFMSKSQLTCCDQFYPSSSVTYNHETLGHKKWNDHFIVSASLANGQSLSNFTILNDGDNLSDHYPILMNLETNISPKGADPPPLLKPPVLKWEKLSALQLARYTSRLQHEVTTIPSTVLHCTSPCRCHDSRCGDALQSEYDSLISAMKKADSTLPRAKPGVEKNWWTNSLTDLRKKSIEIQTIWINEGRPRQGPTHEERLRVRAAYKRAIRAAQRAPKQAAWDRLHSQLVESDTNSFWRTWRGLYNKNKSPIPSVVNGCSSEDAIADSFMQSFRRNSTPNNQANVDRLNTRFETSYIEFVDKHNESCNCMTENTSLSDVIDGLLSMKNGKSSDEDNIAAEHLMNAPLNLLVRLTQLFNQMLKHAFVSEQFRRGFMVPIIKDHQGNHSDIANYRGITISPIVSKLFEHALKITFWEYLTTSHYQFGFKKHNSTSHALHCLRETVNYYVNNGSRTFCTFLDASKAFDRLMHSGLFLKLMERNIPLVLLDVMISWYDGLQCRVKWGKQFSEWFSITAGVRQGGVLSPDLYSIYVDELLTQLQKCGKGAVLC